MNSDKPSMLVKNWKLLSMEEKMDFLDYLVSQMEVGSEKYDISEYFEIFLLAVFLNTERKQIIKEQGEEIYTEPSFASTDTTEVISDQRDTYILRLIANALVRSKLPWQATFKLGLRNTIKAENFSEYSFYRNCKEAEKKLATFIEAATA